MLMLLGFLKKGFYKKLDTNGDNDDIETCAKKAWEMVWEEQKGERIRRAFTSDYESSVPVEYTKDGKAHCYLYIVLSNSKHILVSCF